MPTDEQIDQWLNERLDVNPCDTDYGHTLDIRERQWASAEIRLAEARDLLLPLWTGDIHIICDDYTEAWKRELSHFLAETEVAP